MISFYLNFLCSDMNPAPFRLVNIGLLAGAGVMTAALVNMLLSLDRESPAPLWIGALVGLFYVSHPAQLFVTLYIWQRAAIGAVFFYLCALVAYFAVRRRAIGPTAGYGLCLLAFVAALFSKEIAVTLAGSLLLLELLIDRRPRNLIGRGAVFCLITLGCVLVLSRWEHAHGDISNEAGILAVITRYYAESGIGLVDAALTQARVVFIYLDMIFFPWPENIRLVDVVGVSAGLMSPSITCAAVLGVGVLACAGIVLLLRGSVIGFGICFFLLNLAPEAFLVPQYQFFGYRAALPMVGVFAAFAAAVHAPAGERLHESSKFRYVAGVMAVGAALVLFAVVSRHEARLWADPIAFWTDAAQRAAAPVGKGEIHPRAQVFHNLGIALQERGRFAEATAHLVRAVEFAPDSPRSLSALAASYARTGSPEKAAELLRTTLTLDPSYVSAYRNLADLALDRGDAAAAEGFANAGLTASGEDADLLDCLGRVRFAQERPDEAVDLFKKAIGRNPRAYASWSNLAGVFNALGRFDDAHQAAREAIALRRDYWRAWEGMGVAFASTGRLDEAIGFFETAVKLNPQDESTRRNLETALQERSESRR
jgi:tetratricopeptide (TPR) repeat protein